MDTSTVLTAEVVSIGDEMTTGQRLDTNSQWLSQQLESLGIRVLYHTTVADEYLANQEVFRRAIERADFVIATGGLGPTLDDLTREVLAQTFDAPLEFDAAAFEHIQSLFARRSRVMPERNRVQAEFPRGSRIIPNPHGTAPGIELHVARPSRRPAIIFALPGVPAEMQEMWEQTVRHRLVEALPSRLVIEGAVIKCFGLGESELESHIPELIHRDHVPRVGITVNRATISLRIRALALTSADARKQIDLVRQSIYDKLSPWIFGEGEEYELQHALRDQLKRLNQSLTTIEVGSNGLLAPLLNELESPQVYRGGVVAPNIDFIHTLVADSPSASTLGPQGLMEWCRRQQADWLLMVNPYPAMDQIIQGVNSDIELLAVSASGKVVSKNIQLGGHPDILHFRIAKHALDWFRKLLVSETPS